MTLLRLYSLMTVGGFALGQVGLLAAAVDFSGDDFPVVPEGFVVEVVAQEPMVRNPTALAFDERGRICVGQGPQYRSPQPDTPGDRVDLLLDEDGDGRIDHVKTFAEGFNHVQGLAWKGRDLWVANSPDLTVVRDTDGDDKADEYIRVYTDLGNLEHGLHGLNFAPDGRLYMSKGNSKGYNKPGRMAPRAFRELWGQVSLAGAPDIPPPEIFKDQTYQRNYHHPSDDWGRQGGVLRCEGMGQNLEIVARGFRNPWDIAFDGGFNWLGTDNDQTGGDKIFAPFHGAHFGWGHAWSYDWEGRDHLPTVPASGPLFEGSGTGIVYYQGRLFPKPYRDVFFINDWLRRVTYLYRPVWQGAWMQPEGGKLEVFASALGGRSMGQSQGRRFDPTDLEVGPDGALYVLSWGREYGVQWREGQQVNEGRVYRIRPVGIQEGKGLGEARSMPERRSDWSLDRLWSELGQVLPVRRVNAQEELVSREHAARLFLRSKLEEGGLSTARETWAAWTLARLALGDESLDAYFWGLALQRENTLNLRLQAFRILADRHGKSDGVVWSVSAMESAFQDPEPRLRFEAVQAARMAGQHQVVPLLEDLAQRETDRLVNYAIWTALRSLADPEARHAMLEDLRGGVRLAALLGLLEDGLLQVEDVIPLQLDVHAPVAALAERWLQTTGAAVRPILSLEPPPGSYGGDVLVGLSTSISGGNIHYTLDGSHPVETSPRFQDPIPIVNTTVLKAVVLKDRVQMGQVYGGEYTRIAGPLYRAQPYLRGIRSKGKRPCLWQESGLRVGAAVYVDRAYKITRVPSELEGAGMIMTSNDDAGSRGDDWLSFTAEDAVEVLLAHDTRVLDKPGWLKLGKAGGYELTDLTLNTTDASFRFYRKRFPAGKVVLGGNANDGLDAGKSQYLVVVKRRLLEAQSRPVRDEEVLDLLPKADPALGRDIFLHADGAGCFQCHRLEGRGNVHAPDLSDIGTRADAKTILESILRPSAAITEGFTQHTIETKDGRIISGLILEQTRSALKLAQVDGTTLTLAVADILEQQASQVSAMPGGVGAMMSARRLADLTSYLLAQKGGQPVTQLRPESGFRFQLHPDRLDILLAGRHWATYLMRHDHLTRPALVNVRTPRGVPLTRPFPAPESEDHALMHPGIWLGYGDMAGHDYWRMKAEVQHMRFVVEPRVGTGRASFAVLNHYLTGDGSGLICRETVYYGLQLDQDGVLLTVDARYQPEGGGFYFGDQEEMGLGVRVNPSIRVTGGNGRIINDRGELNGKGTWGKAMRWIDYSGTMKQHTVGLQVMPHPENPRPSWAHSRDYGVIVANPFPRQPSERREPYVKTAVGKNETFRLRYGVFIHETEPGREVDLIGSYERFLTGKGD